MTQPRVEQVTERAAVVVRVFGEIDLATVDVLAEGTAEAITAAAAAEETSLVVVDLDTVEFISSSGLSALVTAHDDAERAGVDLVVAVGASHFAARTIETAGLGELLRMTPSVAHVLKDQPRHPS